MSDVSMTSDLIAELRKAQDAAGFIPHGTMDHETQWLPFANLYNAAEALLEDLEAATRVPVQGEPGDDRECDCEAGPGSAGCKKWCASRATVPDAATEEDLRSRLRQAQRQRDEEREAKQGNIRALNAALTERDAALAECRTLRGERNAFEDDLAKEIDRANAALAAVERVRVLHPVAYSGNSRSRNAFCATCTTMWPCATIRALDGAPEPEWEERLAACEQHGTHCWSCARHKERRRPAGPWEACNE